MPSAVASTVESLRAELASDGYIAQASPWPSGDVVADNGGY